MSWPEIEVYAHDRCTHPERGCCTAAESILCLLCSLALHMYSMHAENSANCKTICCLIIILSSSVIVFFSWIITEI